MQVYSLVSSAKRHSADFTQLPPGHRAASFISHLNSPGSIQPGCHFRRTELFKHTSLHCPTRYPLTPGSQECTCEQSALSRSTTSAYIQRRRGSNPRSLACTSRTLPLSRDAPQRHIMADKEHTLYLKVALALHVGRVVQLYTIHGNLPRLEAVCIAHGRKGTRTTHGNLACFTCWVCSRASNTLYMEKPGSLYMLSV